MAITEVRGCCPHDCPDTCSWTATVEDGAVTGVHGNKDHPFTAGHLCIKVNHYEERVYHPDRLLTPLVRTGAKGTGSFREAAWDEALGVVCDGLTRVIEQSGSESVLPFSYMGTQGVLQGASMDRRFFHRLGSAELDRNICLAAGGWAYAFTYPGFAATDPELIGEADVAIAWGVNPFSTHLHFWPYFQAVKKNGGTLICVDPFRTKTAAASDIHLQLRPGSDAALALGMMHVIFAEGLEDAEFLVTRTDGADDLRARAAEWPLDRTSRATGIAADQIAEVARLWAGARPGFVKLGPGANHQPNAGQAFRAVLALPAVTGAWKYPGGGAHVHSADAFPAKDDAMTRPNLRAQPASRTVTMTGLGDALTGDGIDALVVYNCNPAVVCPDTNAVTRGLARDDLFTVVLELMPTDTMAYADVVLPATTQLEHLDVLWSWGHYYLSLNRPAIPPRGDTLPNTEIFRRLATAMGYDEPELYEDDEALVDTYLADCTAEQRAALDAHGYVKMPVITAPDARVQLRSDTLAEIAGVDPLPQGEDFPEDVEGLILITPKSHHFLNSQLVNHERLRKAAGRALALVAPADAAMAGIVDGGPVVLTNEHGTLELDASVTDNVLEGTVVVLDNWWHRDVRRGPGVNALTGQTEADLGAAPVFTARVQISPVSA
jgi:anaerobic selenocysteine-containing dehydrogenase